MKIEHKTFQFKMDNVDDSGIFTGYASTFGNVDLGGDIVDKGAFTKTLNESKGKVPILDHHNPQEHIGWNLEAREDERGLFVKGQLDLNVQRGREKHSLMKKAVEIGANMGLSIGYRTIKSAPDKNDSSIRRLKEALLHEYSIATFPMNQEAGVTAVKAESRAGSTEIYDSLVKLSSTFKYGQCEIKGSQLAGLLNRRIATLESDDLSRSDIIVRMGRAAGISPGTVNQILEASINCPPIARLRGFSRVLDVSADSLQSAAERDGCDYP